MTEKRDERGTMREQARLRCAYDGHLWTPRKAGAWQAGERPALICSRCGIEQAAWLRGEE